MPRHSEQHLERHRDRPDREDQQRAEPPQRQEVTGQGGQDGLGDQRAAESGNDRVDGECAQTDECPVPVRRTSTTRDAEDRGHQVTTDDPTDH